MLNAQPKNLGDLRAFLIATMVGVRDGSVDPLKADRIAKLATAVNDSFNAETQLALANFRVGGVLTAIGDTAIGGETVEHIAIEHQPVPVPPVRKPATVAPIEASHRVFCDQCERTVTLAEGNACVSAFCKARPEARS